MSGRGPKDVTSLVLALALAAAPAAAQVGHEPRSSPYVDLDRKHEATLLVGHYLAQKDPAGVAPRSGMFIGAQYAWRMSGPAHLVAEVGRVGSERTVVNPAAAPDARRSDASWPLYMADLSLGLSLTGGRSWHSLVPMVRGGIGTVSDFKTRVDTGGFRFGTRFAFVTGAGVRWVPGGSLQLRADVTDRLYTIAYPETYYVSTGGATPVVTSETARKRWTNNPAITVGVSYFFGR